MFISRPVGIVAGLVALLSLVILLYLWYRKRPPDQDAHDLPIDYFAQIHAPDLLVSARIPTRYPRFYPTADLPLPILPDDVPRYPPLTLESYQRLIDRALKNRVLASIPIPPLYLDPLMSYFAVDADDGRLTIDEEALVDDDCYAHLLVIPVAGTTTGEHRAIR